VQISAAVDGENYFDSGDHRGAAISRRDWLGGAVLAAGTLVAAGTGSALLQASQPQRDSGAAANWWTWRGPLGNNIAASSEFASKAISLDRVHWQSAVAGRGHSSPIVTDQAIFLTSADTAQGTQSVLAYNRDDGKLLWSQVVHRGGLPRENHRKNTEASPTAAFDGSRLLTAFYNSDAIWVTAFSPHGERIWQRSIGPYVPKGYKYGYAASPAIYQDTAIIIADFDGPSFLTAISLQDGKPVWRVDRHHQTSYSSPIVAKVAGRDQLLLSGGGRLISYDPADGTVLWNAPATAKATCGTVVWDAENVYASGGYPESETVCVRGDGSERVVWTNNSKCYEQSMLASGGYVYAVTDQGIAHCWRGSDGQLMWRQRLGGNYSASPLLVGQTIYAFSEQGESFAFAATPERFVSIGSDRIGDEVFATPSVVGDTMYLRVARSEPAGRQEYLLAVR
jgi:outer membrane protein assembly factor BamB